MGEIVNLRRARKRKARGTAEAAAGENRLLHGRTKGEKLQEEARRDAAERHLTGHLRDKPER